MERKLLKNLNFKLLLVIVAMMTFGFMEAQTISTPVVSENPLQATFTLTNGGGQNRFLIETQYNYILMSGNLSFGNFSIGNPPPIGNGNFLTYTLPINAPLGTIGGVYSANVQSTGPNYTSGLSNAFTLYNDFEIGDQDYTGYIHCQTPAVSYRLVTIKNTGNIIDKYNLSLNPNVTGTEQNLNSSVISMDGNVLTETPVLMPEEPYTFMIRFEALPGTQPNKNNFTDLIISSYNENALNLTQSLHTWIYCGNGNNIPGGADSPDLRITKTSPPATVGDEFIYTITLSNKTTKNALTPTIIDTIPANLTVVEYYLGLVLGQPDTRNIFLTYDEPTRLFQTIYPTNNQNKFDSNSPPVTIHIKAVPNCYAPPSVVNTVYVYSFTGDADDSDNIASVTTNINFDTSNPTELGNWQGSFTDNWFDCKNWSKGIVPDSSIDVTIPNTSPNQPNIDNTDIAQTKSLTLQMGATLSMEANSNLHISGNWTNNLGTFIPGTGTVSFVGSNTDQTIFDLSEEPTFYNLTVNTSNNVKVLVTDGHGLFVNNQLNLSSGDLRLNGKAQLIQTHTETNINGSVGSGKILRDQQGQLNKYNYNYWSSPVGTTNSGYTIDGVMKDGSDPDAALNINWTGELNGLPTSPITVSTRWLYKFQNANRLYENWSKISQTTSMSGGLGYTMKGVDMGSGTQNYTFIGKPFSGDYIHFMGQGKQSLLGNPYPSALDAYKFLDDNVSALDGVLMFWDHFVTTNSHLLASYEGGYALLTKTSAITAVSPSGQVSTKVPQRYIPVGQGFMVNTVNAGNIIFKNSQRAFVKEDEPSSNVPFGDVGENPLEQTHSFIKIHLGMVTQEELHHPIVIGFMNDKATEALDYGYDAKRYEFLPNQFYFVHTEADLLIQGVGQFDENNTYPLGVIVKTSGNITFELNEVENLSASQSIYIYDNERQVYHDLNKNNYSVNLNEGVHNTRFSLRFKNHSLENSLDFQTMLSLIVVYYQSGNIIISNPSEQITIKGATLFNLQGKQIIDWKIIKGRVSYIELPVKSISTDVYMVQVQTDAGTLHKKVLIKQ